MKKICAIIIAAVVAMGAYFAWHFGVTPRYGWLVFGPEGKVRMLLRANDEIVDIDLNRNGRFEAAERIKNSHGESLSIPVSDGKTSYIIRRIASYEHEGQRNITVQVDIKGRPEFRQLGDLWLSRTRAVAPMSHFNGPLKVEAQTVMWELPKDLVLCRGEKGTDIRVNIGTIRKSQRCWTTVYTQSETNNFFPTNVFPWVEVEFPGKSGTPPVVTRYPLNKVC